MKSILCFGDSLTWGFEAGTWKRHPFEVRWPNAMQAKLGAGYRAIEEGHNGRTTMFDDPSVTDDRNGSKALPILLSSHHPLDLVIIMLGTNDVKFFYRCRAFDAALGMGRLISLVRTQTYNADYRAPDILIVSPPPFVETKDEFFHELFAHAAGEGKLFATHYARVAKETNVHFFDAGSVASCDPIDGIHMDAANTKRLGEALAPVVKGILG